MVPRPPENLPGLRSRASLAAAAAALLLAACNAGSPGPGAGGPPGGGMPPPEVGVVTVATGEVGLTSELPGRLEASRIAQVRARAAGIIQKRVFNEGSDVAAGQALFRIDAAPYAAALASAQATLARAEANLMQAAALAERYEPLVKANAVSQQEYTAAVAARKLAEADVAAGRAAVQTARINLDYTEVGAPIAGRIGRALVTEGALVGQGEATVLAVVQQVDPLYVNFTQSASELFALRKAFDQGQLKRADARAASVRVVLEDGTEHPRAGRLLFSDLTVDATSGQVTLRAEVPNPGGVLLPGMYVRVRLEQARAANAVLMPQQAVTRSPQGDTVMVVGADGKVAPRPVKVGGSQGSHWVIQGGLQPGDQVMVDGFQKLRPDVTVKPVPWKPAAAGQSGPAGAPAAAAATPAAPAASRATTAPAASAASAAKS